jgi:hypothetical protein
MSKDQLEEQQKHFKRLRASFDMLAFEIAYRKSKS